MGLDVHTVCDLHDQRAGNTWDSVSLACPSWISHPKGNVQLCMVKKFVGGLGETREKAVSVLALIIVEVCDRFHAEEFMKEPTSPPQSASIIKVEEAP